MSDGTLQLSEIRLERVLGIDRPGFALSDLSPAINLVYGPNGSGKSTTAWVIQELLWPGRTGLEHPSVSGQFQLGEDLWQVTLDAGHPEITCDGRPGELPSCGPAEHAGRYRLALHELVTAEDADFAEAIANASQGGYDVDAAASDLSFSMSPSLPRARITELREARQALDQARRSQEDLDRKAHSLDDLRSQLDGAENAQRRAQHLEAAQAYREAAAQRDAIIGQLESFPRVMGELRGDERKTLADLADQRKKSAGLRAEEEERIRRAQQQLTESGLPQDGAPDDLLDNMRGWQQQLSEAERGLRQAKEALQQAEAKAATAQRRLGEQLTDAQPAALETVEIADVNLLAREADQVGAVRVTYDERGRQLEREKVELGEAERFEPSALQRGIAALEEWLASPAPVRRREQVGWPVIVTAALAAVLAVALAVVHHPAWAIGLLGAAALLAVEWQRVHGAAEPAADPRATHRQTYAETALPEPSVWEAQPVRELRRQLLRWVQAHAREEDRRRRLAEWRDEAAALEAREQQVESQRVDLERRLGVQLNVTHQWLPTLVENLVQFHRSSADAMRAAQRVETLGEERNALLAHLGEGLASVGGGTVESAEAALRTIERLSQRAAAHRQAQQTVGDARARLERTIEPNLQDLADRRRKLLARLGLEDDRERQLDDWLAELPRFRKSREELSEAEAVLNERRGKLAEHEELLELASDELQRQLAQAQSTSAHRDELLRQITEIEHSIEQAKAGHELSAALADYQAAEARLLDERSQNVAAAVGAVVAQWVRQTAVEGSRPQVFRRANELLGKFTRYTLQLGLDDGAGGPTFRAQTGQGRWRPLDRLSAGERVQLLMAVRVAFLEQDETARLPLLLDEALGTSDDSRAGEIIDSIIALANDGRQIFYFTAQYDEVGKWKARLEELGMPYRAFDLAQLRGLAAAEATPLAIAPVEVPSPPAPTGMTHADYGRVLNVPGIDPAAETLDELHLWHLVEDVELLHRLLRQRVSTWRQLRLLFQHSGADVISGLTEGRPQIEAAAKAVDAACAAWRIGRGKPVDRAVLQDADGVTDTFMPRVCELSERVGGDARAMLEGLAGGEVKGFRTISIERLREYFAAHGHLPHEDPLPPDEIRLRVLSSVADELRDGVLAQAQVERIIADLGSVGAMTSTV